jgi:hypothetical protein
MTERYFKLKNTNLEKRDEMRPALFLPVCVCLTQQNKRIIKVKHVCCIGVKNEQVEVYNLDIKRRF